MSFVSNRGYRKEKVCLLEGVWHRCYVFSILIASNGCILRDGNLRLIRNRFVAVVLYWLQWFGHFLCGQIFSIPNEQNRSNSQ